jgi:hypothetical protein
MSHDDAIALLVAMFPGAEIEPDVSPIYQLCREWYALKGVPDPTTFRELLESDDDQ